jgi:hypothetical protein
MTLPCTRAAAALILFATACSTQAFTYDETVSPDLSNDRLSPTLLSAAPGVNSLTMTSSTGERDYFTFTVPTGWLLSSIFHKSYASADDLSFFALQSGSAVTEPPTGTNAANLLGYTHFGVATVNTEIIDNLAGSNASTPAAMGFTAPLDAGSYAFWVQQTGVAAQYSFDFVLTPVPEPEQWALMLGGGLFLALRLLRRRRAA